MPKKTRKQKLLSDSRRSQITQTALSYSYRESTPTAKQVTELPKSTLVTKDLKKTLFLGMLFITFEILLAIFSQRLGW